MIVINSSHPVPVMRDAKRIWDGGLPEPDTYVEFKAGFGLSGDGVVILRITADSSCAVWLNGKLVHLSGCGDYPWYKLYDTVDISDACAEYNEINIGVWYHGAPSQNYYVGEPGVMFAITRGGESVLVSDRDILCRRDARYRNGYCKTITSQLGFSFLYDADPADFPGFENSVEYPAWENLVERKTGPMRLKDRAEVSVTELPNGYLVDLGEERVGFLDLSFFSPEKQMLTVSYGEHLENGLVPRMIGSRDFSVEYIARAGKNVYMNPFRRLAGRYLQIVCEKPLSGAYMGLREVELPVTEKPIAFADPLDQSIYEVSVNTLKKCMHEHYEDCPWREQAMYTMDSRNQMLCGYEAFEGYEFQRQNLLLMAQGQRSDGLLPLCFPAGIDIPIPSYSLIYPQMVAEYVDYSDDRDILDIVKPVVQEIIKAFSDRIEENGLIACFPYPYWNFYEWEEGSDREDEITRSPEDSYEKRYDLILNAMYVRAVGIYDRLYGDDLDASVTVRAIQDAFYVKEKGTYRLSSDGMLFGRLGNSMALLIGLGDEKLADALINGQTLIPVSLAMNTFFYDALLRFGDRYKEWIIGDIRTKYKKMLDEGAATFWETEKGWRDFGGAGSLCHGWSAMPAYYLNKLSEKRRA